MLKIFSRLDVTTYVILAIYRRLYDLKTEYLICKPFLKVKFCVQNFLKKS